MSDLVGNQIVGFLMTRLICSFNRKRYRKDNSSYCLGRHISNDSIHIEDKNVFIGESCYTLMHSKKLRSMQRPEAEVIRTQIQPSKQIVKQFQRTYMHDRPIEHLFSKDGQSATLNKLEKV